MSIRALAKRVQHLEQAQRVPRSPFEIAFGSVESWEVFVATQVDAGALDARDMPAIVLSVRRWHIDRLWGGPQRARFAYDDQ